MNLVNRLLPVTSDEDMLRALLLGQEHLHSFGITAWQDAIIGGYGDAGDAGPAYVHAIERGLLTGRVVGALWWDRNRGLEQVDELVDLQGALPGSGLRRDEREDHAGRRRGELHRGDGGALPRRGRCADAGQRGLSFVEPGLLARGRDPPGRARVPGARPRHRRPCGAGVARRRRGRAAGQRPHRQPAPHRAPAGRPPGRRPALPRAGRRREPPVALGSARAADGRAHAAVPRGAARLVAVPLGRPAARGRRAGGRLGLVRLDPRPAGRRSTWR